MLFKQLLFPFRKSGCFFISARKGRYSYTNMGRKYYLCGKCLTETFQEKQ